LFAEAFVATSGGFRLLRLARPPLLFYGLYGSGAPRPAERRLLEIILQRNLLAERLDCFLQCGCTEDAVRCQALLDTILYAVDRAIDLYALGTADDGIPERRAGAYGYVIAAFLELNPNCQNVNNVPDDPLWLPVGQQGILRELQRLLLNGVTHPNVVMPQELCLQRAMQQRWENLVTTMAPACVGFNRVFTAIENVIDSAIRRSGGIPNQCLDGFNIPIPAHPDISLANI